MWFSSFYIVRGLLGVPKPFEGGRVLVNSIDHLGSTFSVLTNSAGKDTGHTDGGDVIRQIARQKAIYRSRCKEAISSGYRWTY